MLIKKNEKSPLKKGGALAGGLQVYPVGKNDRIGGDVSQKTTNLNKYFMKRLIFITVLSFIFSIKTIADQVTIDSLENVLKIATKKEKAEVLNELAAYYLPISHKKSFEYSNQALELAKKFNSKIEEAKALNNIGNAYYYQSNYEKTIEYYKKSLIVNEEICNSFNEDEAISKSGKEGIAISLNNIGIVYEKWGNYEKAIEYYQKALKIFEELGNRKGMAALMNNIGIVYYNWTNYEKAIEYYQKSLQMEEELGNKQGTANSLNNIGLIYMNWGNYKKSIEYYQRSLKIGKEIGDKQGISNTLNNIGIVYYKWNSYKKALEYYKKSLKIREELGNKRGIAYSLSNIGNVLKNQDNFNKALKYYNKSLQIAKLINLSERIIDNYQALSETYFAIGNYKKSLEYYKLYTEVKDSIFNTETHKQITEIQTKYETEKKEKEIELLNKDKALKETEIKRQKLFRNSFIVGFVLFVLLAFLAYNRYRIKKKANKLLARQNIEINQQKEEIQIQAEQLEITNKELEKLSIVASETDNSVVIADENGNIEWVNEGFTRLFGYTLQEFTEEFGKNLIDSSKNSQIRAAINQCLSEKKSVVYSTQNTTRAGKKIWTQTTITPILSHEGNILKLVAIDSEITKIKEAEEKIKAKNIQITDSINYAKRIQDSILLSEEEIQKYLPDSFIYFQPRDIVSGDFYWFAAHSQRGGKQKKSPSPFGEGGGGLPRSLPRSEAYWGEAYRGGRGYYPCGS